MIIGDIFQEARDQVDATNASYPDATLLRRVNTAYEDLVADIINADGTWQFDDSRYSTLPIGVCNLVQGQSLYSFSTVFLEIENVKILDLAGHWHILKPWDQSQSHIPEENYQITPAFPRYYDKEGNSIFLLPPPTSTVITLTGGLKVQFKRTASLFSLADVAANVAIPGFASPFHILLALKAALPYAMSYKKDRVPGINAEITRIRALMLAHYGMREKDKRKVMTTKPTRHR